MRDILFRGKRIDDGTWVEGSLYVTHYDRAGVPEDDYKISDIWYGTNECDFPTYQSGIDESVDPATIGQYIGICDKYGQRIFEGDIVATQYGRLCKVEWFSSEMHQGWDLKPLEDMHSRPNESTLWRSDYLEVVGNIYDGDDEYEDFPVEDDWDYSDICYECTGYGDDYSWGEDGELVSACPTCPFNRYKED